jgi:hypothetical protein
MTGETGPNAASPSAGMQSEGAAGHGLQNGNKKRTAAHGSISETTFDSKQKENRYTRLRCGELDLFSIDLLEPDSFRSFLYINNVGHHIERLQYLESKHNKNKNIAIFKCIQFLDSKYDES